MWNTENENITVDEENEGWEINDIPTFEEIDEALGVLSDGISSDVIDYNYIINNIQKGTLIGKQPDC